MNIFKRFPSVLNTDRQNSAVSRVPIGHEFTSWPMNAEDCVNKDTSTSRCVDWFRYSNQVYPSCSICQRTQEYQYSCESLRGIQRQSPLRHFTALSQDRERLQRVRREGLEFAVVRPRRPDRTCAQTNIGETSKRLGSPWEISSHYHDAHQQERRAIYT